MSTETNSPQFVQTPAQEEAPVSNGVPVPEDHDLYRGKGGDYIVDDTGRRVPLHEHNKKHNK